MADTQERWRQKQKKNDINAFRKRQRHFNLFKKYGLTLEKYNELFAAQKGVCRICQEAPTNGMGKRLHVDHDHKTGIIRGLLCHGCNTGLGAFKESPECIKRALQYLRNQR